MQRLELDRLALELHSTAVTKKFWDEYPKNGTESEKFVFYAKQIAMIHSEATEVLESIRKRKDSHETVEELADILIRTLDLYGAMYSYGYTPFSLQKVLESKMDKNLSRPDKHGVLG